MAGPAVRPFPDGNASNFVPAPGLGGLADPIIGPSWGENSLGHRGLRSGAVWFCSV